MTRRSITFVGYFAVICAVLLICAFNFLRPKYSAQQPTTNTASALKPSKPLNRFSLTDTNGNQFTEKSFRGHWTLMFFGYPLCPDICPRTLGIVRDSWNIFTTNNQSIPTRFVFTDIGQQPVSRSDLKMFLQNYHDEFIGLSGSSEQLHALSDQLGIFAQQQDGKLDHTAALLLIDPQGKLRAVISPPFSPQELANDLQVLTRG